MTRTADLLNAIQALCTTEILFLGRKPNGIVEPLYRTLLDENLHIAGSLGAITGIAIFRWTSPAKEAVLNSVHDADCLEAAPEIGFEVEFPHTPANSRACGGEGR